MMPTKATKQVTRVLFVSTSYPRDGGDWRGIFIRHLVHALAHTQGLELSVWAPPGELPALTTSITTAHEADWLGRLMAAGGISHRMRNGGANAIVAPLKLVKMLRAAYLRNTDVDIYHINWLQCALPLPNNGKPALITVLGNDLKLLRLPFMRAALRRMARKRKVAICPNADWMYEPLQAAFGDVAKVIPTSFGIDPCWYAIERGSIAARPNRWLVVTRLTADKLGPLFDWSRDKFRDTKRELHLFGPMQEEITVPEWVHYHGSATPEQLASTWFPDATGLITLSRHAEGRPQVMLEAMASSIPIVASRMPAHATIVQDGVTGILCDSIEDYGHALEYLEQDSTNASFGQASRNWVKHEIGTWDDCAQRYARIYSMLLGGQASE